MYNITNASVFVNTKLPYFCSVQKLSKSQESNILENLDKQLTANFTEAELDQLAIESKFVQRSTNRLSGSLFFHLLLFNIDTLKEQSLLDLSRKLDTVFDVDIKRQSLQDKFNENTTLFLKNVLKEFMNKSTKHVIKNTLQEINRILIKDSTSFQIPETLKDIYPGSGGNASKAGLRIQFEYDILSGEINDLSINAFNDQDATNSKITVHLLKEGDLIIRDLAYVGCTTLKILMDKLVKFICRATPGTNIYELVNGEKQKINFKQLHLYMKKNKLTTIVKDIFYGMSNSIEMKLIIDFLPEDVVNKRLRKAKKEHKHTLTDEFIARAHFNLMLTNLSEQQIEIKKIYEVYRVRWQIELIFKIFKSIVEINEVKKVQRYRFESYIYLKLIYILFSWNIYSACMQSIYNTTRKQVSSFKVYKALRADLSKLYAVFTGSKKYVANYLQNFCLLTIRHNMLEVKKGDKSYFEMIDEYIGLHKKNCNTNKNNTLGS